VIGTRNNTVSFIDTYNKLMVYKAIGKKRRKAKERAEKPAPGMSADRRADAYRKQNGGNHLTTRQVARILKKGLRKGEPVLEVLA
jgi:hypothetical protein